MPHSARLRRSVGLVIGHGCRRPARARVSARRSASGSRYRRAMCRTQVRRVGCGHPGRGDDRHRVDRRAEPGLGYPDYRDAGLGVRMRAQAGPTAGVPVDHQQVRHSAQIIQDRAQRRDLAPGELARPAGRYPLEIFAAPRPEKPTTPASTGNPVGVIHRPDLAYDADPLSARPVPGSAGLRPSGCVPSAWRSCRTARPACARTAACPSGGWRGRRPPRRR